MASKDESFLYSGVASSNEPPKTPREAQKLQKKQDFIKLKPGYEVILEDLQNEKSKISDLSDFIAAPSIPADELKSELLARKKYLAYLNGLIQKCETIMKEADK